MKKSVKKVLIKVAKTMAEVALSFLTIGMTIQEVDWEHLVSVTLLSGLITILFNIKEIKEE